MTDRQQAGYWAWFLIDSVQVIIHRTLPVLYAVEKYTKNNYAYTLKIIPLIFLKEKYCSFLSH